VGLRFSALEVPAAFPLDRVSLPFSDRAWREASFPGVGWYTYPDEQSFYRVFDSLELHQDLHSALDELLRRYAPGPVEYCMHFRHDRDSISHWSVQNGLSEPEFETKLLQRYRALVVRYYPRDKPIYLIGSANADLLGLRDTFHFLGFTPEQKAEMTRKYMRGLEGNELGAAMDFLLGTRCTQIFTGNHNIALKRGSSFSYVLWRKLSHIPLRIMIDLDNISAAEEVFGSEEDDR
jgi:hypothetical protein